MKKFIFMMVAVLAMTVSAMAQQTNFAGSSKFTDNWSVGVNGGVQTNLYDWNAPEGAVFGITLNKQVTPVFGITLEANGGVNNIRNWYSGVEHVHNWTMIDQFSTFADGRVNITNLFDKYNGVPRTFEIETVTGVGYGHRYSADASDVLSADALLAKAGLNLNFNIGKDKAWTVSVQPAVVWNTSATTKFDSRAAVGQITAGVIYHFKTSNKKHFVELPEPVVVETPVEKVVEKVVTVEKVVETVATTDNAWSVNFAKGSSEITSNVNAIAEQINKTKGKVVVSGFTSPEGSEKTNVALGIARAKALKDALVKAGVDVSRIEIDNDYNALRTATVIVK